MAVLLAVVGIVGLNHARTEGDSRQAAVDKPTEGSVDPDQPRPGLSDLAVLAFIASLVFMALEMVAGRLVQRHLGSEHLRLDQRDRRAARRPQPGKLPGGQDRRLRQERERGELALPGGLDHELDGAPLRIPAQVVRR